MATKADFGPLAVPTFGVLRKKVDYSTKEDEPSKEQPKPTPMPNGLRFQKVQSPGRIA